jgi:hypothetical protein
MRRYRRYQLLPPYAYCMGCRWADADAPEGRPSQPVDERVEQVARAHADDSRHEVRLVRTQEVIIRPAEFTEEEAAL